MNDNNITNKSLADRVNTLREVCDNNECLYNNWTFVQRLNEITQLLDEEAAE